MLCLVNSNTDIYFNLAAEEYFFKNFSEDCFMLWRSGPSVVVGKHQNTLAEINIEYVQRHQIKVARRLTGGGTVYHDQGNLNFTFIMKGEEGKLVDFRKYTAPIQDILDEFGVETRFEGHNNLLVNGKKISGNAEHVYKKRVLHHGTLLFSTNLKTLSEVLKISEGKYTHKGVKSIRSQVTNLSEHLDQQLNIIEFRDRIFDFVLKKYSDARRYKFTEHDFSEINKLAEKKYSSWDWNFGYSPKYDFLNKGNFESGFIEVKLHVEKGIIEDIKIVSDFVPPQFINSIERYLTGNKHTVENISDAWNTLSQDIPIKELSKEKVLRVFI